MYNVTRSAFTKPLLLWKSDKYYILLCVLAHGCLRVGACAHGRRHMRMGVGMCARACILTQNSKGIRQIITYSLSGSATFFGITS